MSIRRRSLTLLLSAFALASFLAWPAACQAPPQPLPLDLIGQVQLNAEQEKRVCEYVKYYADMLNSSDSKPGEIEKARDELIRPLNQPNAASLVKPAFRGTYARCAVTEMENALNGGDVFRAVNAMLVLAQVGTDRAANALLQHIDPQAQPQWQIRLRAADSLRMLLQGGTLDARKVVEVSRRVREAVDREEDGRVLYRHLSALQAADEAVQQPGDHSTIRGLIGESIKAGVKRAVAQPEPSREALVAVGSALVRLREGFTRFSKQEAEGIGAQIGPSLHDLLAYAQAHWDKAQSDPGLTKPMSVIVASSEGLLQYIDNVLPKSRPTPSSDMNNAWKSKDKPKYEQGLSNWQSVVTKPPYKP
jgi:hypothetical protein